MLRFLLCNLDGVDQDKLLRGAACSSVVDRYMLHLVSEFISNVLSISVHGGISPYLIIDQDRFVVVVVGCFGVPRDELPKSDEFVDALHQWSRFRILLPHRVYSIGIYSHLNRKELPTAC